MTEMPAAGRKAENPWLKLALELGPLLVFFFANGRFGIFVATGAFMAAMAVALIASWLINRRLAIMPLVTGVVVAIFGTLTLILHDDKRDAEALPLVERSRRLRAPLLGDAHALVGECDRLLGVIHAALGDAQAEAELQRAVRILDAAYGPTRAPARRAQLSLAKYQALHGSGPALAQLDALGKLPGNDFELRKVAWQARAEAAGLRCHGPQRAAALGALRKLDGELRVALPEGGSIVRKVAAIAARCR